MVTLETIRVLIPYVFGFMGIFTLYSIADSINENLYAVRCLLIEYKRSQDQTDLTFEYVTCAGCGQSVSTGTDNFTPAPHNCEKFFTTYE